eukprot:6644793-Pyramimonas_sp.AAC.1
MREAGAAGRPQAPFNRWWSIQHIGPMLTMVRAATEQCSFQQHVLQRARQRAVERQRVRNQLRQEKHSLTM